MKTDPSKQQKEDESAGYRNMIVKLVAAKAVLIAVVVMIILAVRQCSGF